jgi:integration host factor subunit beta
VQNPGVDAGRGLIPQSLWPGGKANNASFKSGCKSAADEEMNKRELIAQLAQVERISLKAAEMAVNVTFDSMGKALSQKGRVGIRGLGSFKVKDYGGYSGRNPMTGVMIKVKAKRLPSSRMGKELKTRVNSNER